MTSSDEAAEGIGQRRTVANARHTLKWYWRLASVRSLSSHDLLSLCSREMRHCLVDCRVLVVVWRCTPPCALCPARMSHSQPHGWVTPSSCFGRLFGRRACRIVEGGRRQPGANGADRVTEGPRQSCARCWQDWENLAAAAGFLSISPAFLARKWLGSWMSCLLTKRTLAPDP